MCGVVIATLLGNVVDFYENGDKEHSKLVFMAVMQTIKSQKYYCL